MSSEPNHGNLDSTPGLPVASTNRAAMTIGEVARRTGLSVDTLRYYERIGLTPSLARTRGRHRVYSEADVAFLEFAQRMRATGMPLDDLCTYVRLMKRGIGTTSERLAMLERHAAQLTARIDELQRSLEMLRMTMALYRAVEAREGEALREA